MALHENHSYHKEYKRNRMGFTMRNLLENLRRYCVV